MMPFTLTSASIDHSIMDGCGPYTFHINGENYHQIGSLPPLEGQPLRFTQLHIYMICNLNPEIGFIHSVDSIVPLELGYEL